MVTVCCLLPHGLEADSLRIDYGAHAKQRSLPFQLTIQPPDDIPGGFSFYVSPWFLVPDLLDDHGILPGQILAYGGSACLFTTMQFGVCDYLKAPWDFEELAARLERVLPGHEFEMSWGRIFCNGVHSTINGLSLDVPAAIHRLVRVLVLNAGQVVSRGSLLKLFGIRSVDSRLIDNYIVLLRRAIANSTGLRQGVLQARYGKGYVLSR